MLEIKIKLWLHEDEKITYLKTLTQTIEILLYMIQNSVFWLGVRLIYKKSIVFKFTNKKLK